MDAFAAAPSLLWLSECKMSDLYELAAHYVIPVSRAGKPELKATVVEALVTEGVLQELTPGSGEEVQGSELSQASPLAEPTVAQPLAHTLCTRLVAEDKPVTLPKFNPLSVESSPGSRLGAREREERERREREFQLRRELLEADAAVRMRELVLKARASPVPVGPSPSVKIYPLFLCSP